ncbi:tRNA (N6-isopentenyl adenosine(37)-C2)-methylthiotransferase MiaB [Sulfidibacter corallicola]|uniref:tRNA-2-methylthio-N(6)-dimethylallyladenosine synthase n=1 Tax=Sulfidibacter corallicola TaxID=2818388 RepID=A0A8A4TJ78_SULCO|nr:tRNA (N6-isopentenyl adenosine(37)-C2)-methylthiotransferase MiaB [Sulfidibacter corallicola]QTD49254.1 tRNA (N6-isopentenyl adenosine(37)-C2)-methylthiotransferase MiaB [Sulfidibacter corallicola]
MTKKHYFIETWGCQMNEHDTEKMAGILSEMGYEPTSEVDQADVYLLNTCTIREKAEEKVFSRLGVLKKVKEQRDGDMLIGVAGCVAQQNGGHIFDRAPYVDLVLGTQALKKLPDMIDGIHGHQGRQVDTHKDPKNHLFPASLPKRSSSLRGRVTIMEGCDNYCTYCIVPFTRGRERSRPWQDIRDEVARLADSGYKEIELLGQNVNSYFSSVNFAYLLRALNDISGIEVIRYVSPHPKDFDREVIEAIRDCPKVATNIHLPAQSGNSRILKRMGREYTRELYLDKVAMIREVLDGVPFSLTSDFIVGFPGEKEHEFWDTVTLLDEVGYDRIFSFSYSERPGTGAVKHGDPVPLKEKQYRLKILQQHQAEVQKELMDARVGKAANILVDTVKPGDRYPIAGRTRDNILVHVESEIGNPERFYGQPVNVDIVDTGLHTLRGKLTDHQVKHLAEQVPVEIATA